MKLRELLELQNQTEINNVITIYDGESSHMFISDEDYENFDLDRFGDAEILYFTAAAIDEDEDSEVHTIFPYLSIHALLEEPPKQNMQETVEEFFDYLDECSNGAGVKMMF